MNDPDQNHDPSDPIDSDASEETPSKDKRVSTADILKFGGLIAFFIVMAVIVVLIWPLIHELFEPGGVDRVIDQVRSSGPIGIGLLLVIQLLQIVVAFIPGEVVQVAAGILYGPWWGAAIVLLGCVISSALVFVLVRHLGAPFVRHMVPADAMEKVEAFEQSGRLNVVVFILFLIPGMPKDVFTYIVPLTSMKMGTFMLLTNAGRIPGIIMSTFAAAGLVDGDITLSIIIFVVAAAIAICAIVFYNRILQALLKRKEAKQHDDRS